MNLIGALVDVKNQPTVVRLDHLQAEDASWISDSYYLTEEVENHLGVVGRLIARGHGSGLFLIGHFGSGKSHFLAYLTQQAELGKFKAVRPVPLSLLNYSSEKSLESIITGVLSLDTTAPDRRTAWAALERDSNMGLLLMLDELSEFLRSKPNTRAFNEDIRFLQFLGEWAQDHRLWILAALQEQIEHTGEIEYDLFRKIKDRYPIRLILSTTHVKDLIAERMLIKKPGYAEATAALAKDLQNAFPDNPMDYADFTKVYPIHPATLTLLEEVRDRFSQARGIIDFTVTRLRGDEARGIAPFLEEPWGALLSPEAIVDHFSDLFEVQPEFLALAQKVFPYYRKHLATLFPNEKKRELARRLLKLLVLVHLSPARESLRSEEAAWWLLYQISSIQPGKNIEIIRNVLEEMTTKGAYLKRVDDRYSVDLAEDGRESLDQLIEKTGREIGNQHDALLEDLVPLIQKGAFNPFTLDRERWLKRVFSWHFHDREYRIYLGGGQPPNIDGHTLQVGLPWGPAAEGGFCYRLVPKKLEMGVELRELAILQRLAQRPLPKKVLVQIEERIQSRLPLLHARFANAYQQAVLYDNAGRVLNTSREASGPGFKEWLHRVLVQLFRQTFPQFESFAPGHGPLPMEAFRQLMDFCKDAGLEDEDAPELVRLLREAYLVPMKLMSRKGRSYRISPKLDQHELVGLVRPLLDHQPSPKRIYQHLSSPVYGLVADQVHLLLLVLLIQGEIEILKGRNSFRDLYQTLPTPIQYDRVVPGKGLSLNQVRDLEILCQGLGLPSPRQANVLAQKRCVQTLRQFGQKQRDHFGGFQDRLQGLNETGLAQKIEKHIQEWTSLEKGENEMQGVQHFLFEIGSPHRFLSNHAELNELPQKLEQLIGKTQRLSHLLKHPLLAESPNLDMRLSVEHLGEPPNLSEPDALESWLESAQRLYRSYQDWYRAQHESWRNSLDKLAVLDYQPSPVIQCRHLGLEPLATELGQLRAQVERERCSGLNGLDFQPVCTCGFNGKTAPIDGKLGRMAELMEQIETGLTHFFQQDKVKAKVREWVESGLESRERTIAYLNESKPYPDIGNIQLFDQHLAGLELFREIEANPLLDLICDRVWEREALFEAVRDFLNKQATRISIKKPESGDRSELVAWCMETALKTGIPLPRGLSLAERNAAEASIRPEWIGSRTLARLERIGLGPTGEDLILRMALEGKIPIQDVNAETGLLAAVRVLPGLPIIETPEQLAHWAATLYRCHDRLVRLARETWLTRLDELAQIELKTVIPDLIETLEAETERQWLVLDGLGLALLDSVRAELEQWLPHWRLAEIDYARVDERTTTDAFYRKLTDAPIQKSFIKRNAIDELIHSFGGDFADLEKMAAVELQIACRKLTELDPGQDLLIFADHGFRLSRDGGECQHGGASSLERIVPIIRMNAYR